MSLRFFKVATLVPAIKGGSSRGCLARMVAGETFSGGSAILTEQLLLRWRTVAAPFNGASMYCHDTIRVAELRAVLTTVAVSLRESTRDTRLHFLSDWHEHDGYITSAQVTSWDSVLGWLDSDSSLSAAAAEDSYVRTGLFPNDYRFYLRFYLDVDHPVDGDLRSFQFGHFDLSCDWQLALHIRVLVEKVHGIVLEEEPAKIYFDRRYGG